MAQPPAYSREKDFTQNFGNETDHAALNAEFDRASNSINDIRTNLAILQADDGKIRASSITTDSLDQEVLDYVQEKALAGANAVADAATAIANSASEKADQAIQTANASNEIAGNADSKADSAVETANVASANADTAISTANTANETALEASGNAETAVTTAKSAESKSDEAIRIANAASTTASNADSKSDSAVETANTAKETAQAASANATTAVNTANSADGKADQALSETAQIDSKVTAAVDEALHDAIIPGLTPETIAGALGYIPYDAETNDKNFATSAEVAEAISEIPNADWNATEGAGEIKNKPGDFSGATAETAGKQGFVPAPEAGAEEKVLTGSGEWKHASGVPIGFIGYYGAATPPAGFLKCDGAAVGRATCPELFAAIGTTYGEGDGETTFNQPNLIGRFAEGSATPGTVKEAGLPNITGDSALVGTTGINYIGTGALRQRRTETNKSYQTVNVDGVAFATTTIDASLCNPTYGKSDTVQPPALTLLPCIKAFDAAVDSGLIDITELANEVAGKADTNLSNLSATGKAKAAHLAMPSGNYVGLSIPVTNTDVTAPADGYFYSVIFATAASNGYMNFINRSTGFGVMSNVPASSAEKHFMPVRKGDVVRVEYNNLSEETTFGFFYAEGSQP